jgi:Skp family chaperone for outer membrane proteins
MLITFISTSALAFKVGVVDYEKIFLNTSEGKRIKKILDDQLISGEKDLKKILDDLSALKTVYKKQESLLSAEGLLKKQTEIVQKSEFFQQEQKKLQRELIRTEAQLQQPFEEELKNIVSIVATKTNVDVTINVKKNPFQTIKNKIDLTNEVISVYEKYKKELEK